MATINVTITLRYIAPITTYTTVVDSGTTSGDPTQLTQGDVLRFTLAYNNVSSGSVSSAALPSSVFTSTTQFSLNSDGDWAERTVKNDATIGSFNLLWTASGSHPNETWYYETLSGTDDLADSFTFTDITGCPRSQLQYSNLVTVSGIDASPVHVAASINNGGQMSINNGSWTSTTTDVFVGDNIQVRITSSANYNTAANTTLTLTGDGGSVSDTFGTFTLADPGAGYTLSSGLTAPNISQEDMMTFFGGSTADHPARPDNLGAYVRNGAYVPDVAANSSISTTSNGLSLSQFAGSETRFLITTPFPTKSASQDTTLGGGPYTLTLTWNLGTDWDTGYGIGQKFDTEQRYTIVLDAESDGVIGDLTITPAGYSTYGTGNNVLTISRTENGNTEKFYTGTITCYVRKTGVSASEQTSTARFALVFFGP